MPKLAATTFHGGKFLSEAELQPATLCCVICGCREPRKLVIELQSDPTVSLLKCSRCNGISASRMPTDKALSDYYAQYYDRNQIELVTFSRPERLAKRILKHFRAPTVGDNISILDFGGGDGTIAKLIADRLVSAELTTKVDIAVVDYAHHALPTEANISIRYIENLDKLDGTFDIILASAILEHIPSFEQTFNQLLTFAAVGALFYARTPYMSAFARILPIDMTYPAHVHDLGAETWEWLSKASERKIDVLKSGPAIVETTLKSNILRTIAAYALKSPAVVLSKIGLPPVWPFYGGWEVIWRLQDYKK